MWLPTNPARWDPVRWQRVLAGPHRAATRLELWSSGTLISDAAPFIGGQATEEWVQAGVRWSFTTSLPPTRQWREWLQLPQLELRPYRGVWVQHNELWEAPLSRYPLLAPEQSLPRAGGPIPISVNDYAQYWSRAQFGGPRMTQQGRTIDNLEVMLREAGFPEVRIETANTASSPATLIEGQRADFIASAAKSINVEVYTDRLGDGVIRDVVQQGTPTSTALIGKGGTAEGVKITPDWDKVYNTVSVSSSATDASFPPFEVAITDPTHPAHPWRLGSYFRPDHRVYTFSSPLIADQGAASATAYTLLGRVSMLSTTHEYSCIPDPTRSAGDTIQGRGLKGLQNSQIYSVTHPMTIGGGKGNAQVVRAVSVQGLS